MRRRAGNPVFVFDRRTHDRLDSTLQPVPQRQRTPHLRRMNMAALKTHAPTWECDACRCLWTRARLGHVPFPTAALRTGYATPFAPTIALVFRTRSSCSMLCPACPFTLIIADRARE